MKTFSKLCCVVMLLAAPMFAVNEKTCPQLETQTTSISGTTLSLKNDCGVMHGTFEYIITGAPATMSAVLSGCMRGGQCTVLETYTGTTSSPRKPTIDSAYDYFKVVPTWTGGTSPTFTVNDNLTVANGGSGSSLTGTSPIVVAAGAISCPTCGTSTGDVHGAASSTANNAMVFADTTGKAVADSGGPMPATLAPVAGQVFSGYTKATGLFTQRVLISGDIPNNGANTTGTSSNVSGTPAFPNGVTATTQSLFDGTGKLATDAFVLANAGVPTGAIDAALNYVSGDPCATVAANIATAIATNPQSIDIYFGHFATIFPNGIVPCLSNPFENKVFSGVMFLGPVHIVKSVPWITPGNQQRVHIIGDGTSDPGTTIGAVNSTLQDCGSEAPGWNGTNCVINGVTVPAFPSTGHALTFTYPHGAFGAGTYYATLWLGGMGAGGTTNSGSFGSVIEEFNIWPGSGGGNFGVYTAGIQEHSYCRNVVVRASNNSAFFFDRVQSNSTGPTHFYLDGCTGRMDDANTATQGYPKAANQIGMGYGIFYEGNGDVLSASGGGCTQFPQAYPKTISGGAITVAQITYGGAGCTSAPACSVGSNHGGTGETCTWGAPSGGVVPSISMGGVGTGYSLGDTLGGGPFGISNATINGDNTANMQAAIVLDGVYSPKISSIHTGYDAEYGVIVGYGSGGVTGGLFENIDLENASKGVLHFGIGIDKNQTAITIGKGGTVATIMDDVCLTGGTGTTSAISFYDPCSLYIPAGQQPLYQAGFAVTNGGGGSTTFSVAPDGTVVGTNTATFTGLNLSGGLVLTGASGAATTFSTSTTNASIFLTPNGTGQVIVPAGTTTSPGLGITGSLTSGLSACATNVSCILSNAVEVAQFTGGMEITDAASIKFSQTNLANGTSGFNFSVLGSGTTEAGTFGGTSTGDVILNDCKLAAAVAMSVSGTPVTFCTWTLPSAVATLGFQCQGTYTTTTATDTFGLGVNNAQAVTVGQAEAVIGSTNTGTQTNGGASFTTSGAHTIFTGASVSNVTDVPFFFHGVITETVTSGTFVLQGILTGTTPAGTINAGTVCSLH